MTINFNNISDAYARANDSLSKIYAQNNILLWEKKGPDHDYSNDYLTFEIVGNSGATDTLWWELRNNNVYYTRLIYYRKNRIGDFELLNNSISVQVGDIIEFYGDNNDYCKDPTNKVYWYFRLDNLSVNVSGNIMSLVDSTNFRSLTTIPADYCFYRLFGNDVTRFSIRHAENLVLPATTLTNNCYGYMFYKCTSLTTAPQLPATTLATRCYRSMFYGCTSLTTAPQLPATTLVDACYQNMFYGCTSLTTAPQLPATTLANACCWGMFNGCIGLTTAPELPATTLVDYCYIEMFVNCISLNTVPVLPATTLVEGCYRSMFYGCTNLNYIKCLATDISATDCTIGWVDGVSNTGTFIKDANTTWPTGTSGIPSGWTISNV